MLQAIVHVQDSSGGSPVPEERSEFCLLRREGGLEVWVRLRSGRRGPNEAFTLKKAEVLRTANSLAVINGV